MSVIVNNTVLSNMALINRLDLLESIFGKVFLTLEVYEEVENGIEHGHSFQLRTKQAINDNKWLLVTGLENQELEIFFRLSEKLHIGEASCLAIAQIRRWMFLTDDGNARNYAEKFNIMLSGTVGILRDAVYEKLITIVQGEKYLQIMIKYGYRSPIKHLRSVL